MINVLIVDDYVETADCLAMLYELCGKGKVKISGIAHNSETMWELLSTTQVDIVSLDIQLGDENGLELCRLIHEKYPNVFIAMCSVEAQIKNQQIARNNGASRFLPKPIATGDIASTIQFYLKKKNGKGSKNSSLTEGEMNQLLHPNV